MGSFFGLVFGFFGCFLIGLLVTAVIMLLLYFLLRAIDHSSVYRPLFFVCGLPLFLLLFFQTTLISGAFKAKEQAENVHIILSQAISAFPDPDVVVMPGDSRQVCDELLERIPIVGLFTNLTEFEGMRIRELPEVMSATIDSYLTSFIWRRVGWSALFVVVTVVLVLMVDGKPVTRIPQGRRELHGNRATHDSRNRSSRSSRTMRR